VAKEVAGRDSSAKMQKHRGGGGLIQRMVAPGTDHEGTGERGKPERHDAAPKDEHENEKGGESQNEKEGLRLKAKEAGREHVRPMPKASSKGAMKKGKTSKGDLDPPNIHSYREGRV